MPRLVAFFAAALILAVVAFGYCSTADNSFQELTLELESRGISSEFLRVTERPVKRMIRAGAGISDIKTVLMDLWSQGVRQRALSNAITAVAELVESGDAVLEASRIASGAAHKAEAEGLSGFGVGMRVKKAVQERKAYLRSIKK